MEKVERIIIALVILAGVLTFASQAVISLFNGEFGTCAAMALIAGLVYIIGNAVKEEL